ncbi:MAG TPA: hypothetical protein VIN03_13885 [Roseateles sp.]
MRPFEEVAVSFASALVAGDFELARSFLTPVLRAECTVAALHDQLFDMFSGYAEAPPTSVEFDAEHSLVVWPSMQPGDMGWAYVGIMGEDFVEAVSVSVSEVNGTPLIREIEWGRP